MTDATRCSLIDPRTSFLILAYYMFSDIFFFFAMIVIKRITWHFFCIWICDRIVCMRFFAWKKSTRRQADRWFRVHRRIVNILIQISKCCRFCAHKYEIWRFSMNVKPVQLNVCFGLSLSQDVFTMWQYPFLFIFQFRTLNKGLLLH